MSALPKPAPNPAVVSVTLVFRGVAVDASKIRAGLASQFPTVSSPRDADHSLGYGPFEFEIGP